MAEHIQSAKDLMVPILTRLFNGIMACNYIPQSFNSSQILVIGKKGKDLQNQDNYRGISITGVTGKILDELKCTRRDVTLS